MAEEKKIEANEAYPTKRFQETCIRGKTPKAI